MKKIINSFFKQSNKFIELPRFKSNRLNQKENFFLFNIYNKINENFENDPFSLFITLIKKNNLLGNIIYGTLEEIYKLRNKKHFIKFFLDKKLYQAVKKDIEHYYPNFKEVKLIISKNGLMIYDNYHQSNFSVLLLTIHSGRWVPEYLKDKMVLSERDRFKEEDVYSDMLYSKIVLKNGGIWVNNKLSRFVCDFNRPQKNCIYFKKNEKWLKYSIWKDLSDKNRDDIYELHTTFYKLMQTLLEVYTFNIIFDGHTMKDKPDRPNISFGTRYIASFYRPIVKSIAKKLKKKKNYKPLFFNRPYSGGFILKWLKIKFPDRFIFSMEINKKIYMNKERNKVYKLKIKQISEDLTHILDI